MAERILLVEDEEKLARMVELELQYEGYEVEKAFDGRTGLELALSGKFDLVLSLPRRSTAGGPPGISSARCLKGAPKSWWPPCCLTAS